MSDDQVRRLPVIDGHALAGMLSPADIARALPNASATRFGSGYIAGPEPRAPCAVANIPSWAALVVLANTLRAA